VHIRLAEQDGSAKVLAALFKFDRFGVHRSVQGIPLQNVRKDLSR
jgi:hypothetical protein